MENKSLPKLVFSVTAGRSGTTYLTYLLDGLPRTISVHEGNPSFSGTMRRAQTDRSLIPKFLREKKIPAIQSLNCDYYIETNHLFCKGLFESLIEEYQLPHLIILRRSARQIAESLVRLDTIPGRTESGLKWYLMPDDPVILKLDGWQELSDYQLCYWYCLEIEARSQKYADTVKELGGKVSEVSLDGLRGGNDLSRLIRELDLPKMPLRYKLRNAFKKRIKRNASHNVSTQKQEVEYGQQEQHVLSMIDASKIVLDKFLS